MRHLTDAQRAERKARRQAKRARTFASIRRIVAQRVEDAEALFPESGAGSARHAWVSAAVALVRTPLGDPIEAAIVNYLIELAVDEL